MLRDVMVLSGVGRDLDVVDRLGEGRDGGEREHDGGGGEVMVWVRKRVGDVKGARAF